MLLLHTYSAIIAWLVGMGIALDKIGTDIAYIEIGIVLAYQRTRQLLAWLLHITNTAIITTIIVRLYNHTKTRVISPQNNCGLFNTHNLIVVIAIPLQKLWRPLENCKLKSF